jgi:indole-3-glycerol phosphate synthase
MSAPDVLVRITERRREVVAAAVAARGGAGSAGDLPEGPPLTPANNRFLAALAAKRRARSPAVIAEVKMGSPRLGNLHGRVDPVAQARSYAANGAACLSVVVEPDFFHGGYDLLALCSAASGLPAVTKDFLVDPIQLVWAKEAGAAAFLLIAAMLEAEEMAYYARLCRGLGLVPLVETHDVEDLGKLLGEPWELVGINNRNLRTFDVDLQRSIALLPGIPAEAFKVAESGIRDGLDVMLLHESGFDAFLIGESLLLADDPGAKLRELTGGSV